MVVKQNEEHGEEEESDAEASRDGEMHSWPQIREWVG